ncbi:GDSL-type esterase/lipase family protein [Acetobacterium bakii]|uniref:GDSL-type esterase/lipase family protein n=1 Tax=Acetobacterium bakii TaxID=52689 RepID=UPI000682E1CE|nr:GDSL-type esterase/lipase family protein [Acetobacterium bakii]
MKYNNKNFPPSVIIAIILIPAIIIGSVFFIYFKKISDKNAVIASGINALYTLQSRDVLSMEEEIDFMKRKAVDADNYPVLFESSVVLGDSIAEGLGLYGYLKPSSLIGLLGKSTATSIEDVPKLVDLAPRNVFIELGLNDLSAPNHDLNSFITSYDNLIDAIKLQLPNTQVYICSIFPVTEEVLLDRPEFAQIEAYNAALVELAKRKNIHYLDTYTLLKTNPQYYAEDGIHMLSGFYPIWLDTLVNKSVLVKLL